MWRLLGLVFMFFTGALVHRAMNALWTAHSYMALSVFMGLMIAAVVSIISVAYAKVTAPVNLDIPEQVADAEEVEVTHDGR